MWVNTDRATHCCHQFTAGGRNNLTPQENDLAKRKHFRVITHGSSRAELTGKTICCCCFCLFVFKLSICAVASFSLGLWIYQTEQLVLASATKFLFNM